MRLINCSGIVCAALLLSLGSIAAQNDESAGAAEPTQLYRWVDSHGHIHFSDAPPQDRPSEAATQNMPQLPLSGVRLADEIERTMESRTKAAAPKVKNDSRCRRYHGDLNKVEIYLEHTPNDRDLQRAADLREQINMECNGYALKRDYGDARCRRYHSKLNRLTIFNRHTPNDRDKQRIDDLRRQIQLEC